MRIRRKIRWLPVILLAALALATLARLSWRQEVGQRANPRPSSITPAMQANSNPPKRERHDMFGVPQVWVAPGWFRRGADPSRQFWARAEETPEHDVHLPQGFWMDVFEVTNARFTEFVQAGGYARREIWSDEGWAWKGARTGPEAPPREGFSEPQQPRAWIIFHEADAYARWRGGRLPTEAEWEYAARGPSGSLYPWGDRWDKNLANTSELGRERPLPIGSFPGGRSWCGAQDLCGNVWEWTADLFEPDAYADALPTNPCGRAGGMERVLRGGSWGGPRASARATRRGHRAPEQPSLAIGFRVVSDVLYPAGSGAGHSESGGN